MVDFYDKVLEVFNDWNFDPETQTLSDLPGQFVDPIELSSKGYCMSSDTEKYILAVICRVITKMHIDNEFSDTNSR